MVQWPAARAKVQGGKTDGGPGFEPSSRARKVENFAACVGKELGSDQDSW